MANDQAVMRAIAALTYDEIVARDNMGVERDVTYDLPIISRSIANDLRMIEGILGSQAKGQTLLFALATAIDEALLALEESLSVD